MRYYSYFLSLVLIVPFGAFSKPLPKPDVYFPNLTHKMGLKIPRLKEGEYEIRVWQKCQLCFGEAHALYLLKKRTKRFDLSAYRILFNGPKFKRSERVNSLVSSPEELWNRLIQRGILALPDESIIEEELHPKPQKDSTWNTIDTDGNISIHAKKRKPSAFFSDGESYHFEVFNANGCRKYAYSNPREYLRAIPEIVELRKVVAILNELDDAF